MNSQHLTPFECLGNNSTQKYRLMQCPFQKQPLQLLYPGRLMMPDYNFEGTNIPNEDMEGLEITRKMSRSLRVAYDMELEALSRHLGGKDKIYPFPAVDPGAIIDDPRLASISLENPQENTSIQYDDDSNKNIYDNLQEIDILDHDILRSVKKEHDQLSPTDILDKNGKLPEYDWEEDYPLEYPSVKEVPPSYYDSPKDNYIEHYKGDVGSNIDENNSFNMNGLFFIGFVIMLVLLMCIIGGAHHQ